jgi:hypothetical protein
MRFPITYCRNEAMLQERPYNIKRGQQRMPSPRSSTLCLAAKVTTDGIVISSVAPSAMENTDPLTSKPPLLEEFAERFLDWVNNSRLEEKTRKFYSNGWRLLKATFARSYLWIGVSAVLALIYVVVLGRGVTLRR